MSLEHRDQSSPDRSLTAGKRAWQAPAVTPLPRLVKLTLQTGGAGAGGAVGGAVGGTGGTGGFGF